MPETIAMTARQKLLAMLTLVIAVVLEIVDLTIVNTALPAIKADLGADAQAAQWVVAGYALAFALFLMAGGRLGDSIGYRRAFLIGVTGFTACSAACGLAATDDQLVLARLGQGMTGAIMGPQVMALVQVMFSPLERVGKLALFGFIGGLAAIIGPIIGGLLIQADLFGMGWRIIFLINLPIGVLAIVAGRVYLPSARSSRPAGYDMIGMLLFGGAVAAIIWPSINASDKGWTRLSLLALAAALPLCLLGWRHVAHRVRQRRPALFDPALFSIRSFAIGLVLSIIFSIGSAGFLLIFAFALQAERGQTALATGLLHVPFGLGAMLGIAVIGRRFLPLYGRWLIMAGALAMALATVVVQTSISMAEMPLAAMVPFLLLAGLGMGTMAGSIGPVTLAQVPRDDAGAASALMKTCQQLGSALGIALVGSVYFAWTRASSIAPSLAAETVVALALLACAAITVWLPRDIFEQRNAKEA